jgi:hypothetical protein
MTVDRKYLSLRVSAPAAPGRYRLTVLLHDNDGVAFDGESQSEVSALIVRLTGPHDAAISAPRSVEVAPGAAHAMSLWVTNLGTAAWGQKMQPAKVVDSNRKPVASTPATHARIVGTWVALGVDDERQVEAAAAASITPTELSAAFAPRSVAKAELRMFVPSAPGDYLLLIDIVTPEAGSLAGHGVEPTIVRVHVAEPAPAATAEPASPTAEPSAPSAPSATLAPAE